MEEGSAHCGVEGGVPSPGYVGRDYLRKVAEPKPINSVPPWSLLWFQALVFPKDGPLAVR